jgi:hypothetical protein
MASCWVCCACHWANSLSRACSQAASVPSAGRLSQGLQGALQSLARGRQLLLGLALQRLLIVKLTLQHQALAELIELLLVALLLLHPVVYLLRNIPRDVQRGAGLLPRFSKRLLFLCEPPGRFGVTLELLRQGLDLPEISRPSSFSAATSFSSASRRR